MKTVSLWMAVALIAGCAAQWPAVDDPITVMTFNVENLFDTTHDADKDDYTYLPLTTKQSDEHRARCADIRVDGWRAQCLNLDWSEFALKRKLGAIAASILANGADGRGPDIVVLQEVENVEVLERLRTEYLAAAGYGPAVLVEGTDLRGIDVAFLSRLPLVGAPVLHPTRFTHIDDRARNDTRGILEATFELPDGELLTGFAVHFPAPFHPTTLRVQSYQFLATLLAAVPADRLVFAAGDFNTIAAEKDVLDTYVAPDWTLAHRAGCEDCRGTHYYAPNDDWSFLDMILVSTARSGVDAGRWVLDPAQTRVGNAWPAQSTQAGVPRRFDPGTGRGVSDHWPLLVSFVRR
ncbi:MAG: endonuclease/exonuclease/phosphatase family protein [Gammaproteobacteria bacterium]